MQFNSPATILQQFNSATPGASTDNNGETPEASAGGKLPASVMSRQFGAYGNNIFRGFINGEEYNPELSGKAGLAIFDEMWRSDAAVQASLKLLMYPITGASYDIEPASDDPEHQIHAAFVKYNLFELLKWKYFVQEVLECLPFGFSVFEKMFKWVDWDGTVIKDQAGNFGTTKQGKGRYYGIDRIDSRRQDTIDSWEMADGNPGVSQITPTGGSFDIPAGKLLIFTNQRRGNNFTGVSVLRSSYKNWYIKTGLEKGMAVAAERQGVGVPYFEAPSGAVEDDLKKARQAMQNIRANEQAYLEMPTGWEYGFLDMKAGTTLDPMPQINYHNRQILLNVLGQHLDQGNSGTSGSKAAGQVHNSILDQSLEGIICTVLEDEINENLIKQLVDMNWTTDAYPRIVHSQLNDESATTLPDALQKLTAAGLITPDMELEERMRTIYNLPDMPDELKETYAERHAPVDANPDGKGTDGKAGSGSAAGTTPATSKTQSEEDDEEEISAADALAQAKSARLQLIQAAERQYAEESVSS